MKIENNFQHKDHNSSLNLINLFIDLMRTILSLANRIKIRIIHNFFYNYHNRLYVLQPL